MLELTVRNFALYFTLITETVMKKKTPVGFYIWAAIGVVAFVAVVVILATVIKAY